MIFSQTETGSIIKGTIIYILLFLSLTASMGQESQSSASDVYQQVFEKTKSAIRHDPFIQNGIYYSYPYYNAVGHPFLDKKEFGSGSVIFREKSYEELSINYDLFNQQLILSREFNGVLQMNLLATQFVSGFQLKGRQFIKADFPGGEEAFFQVISETGNISCYYAWYKERREVRDSGNRSIYSFSDQKSKRYLYLGGQLTRYKSNKSFLKAFTDVNRAQIKEYMQENQILVMEASDQAIKSLIGYCDSVLHQESNQSGK